MESGIGFTDIWIELSSVYLTGTVLVLIELEFNYSINNSSFVLLLLFTYSDTNFPWNFKFVIQNLIISTVDKFDFLKKCPSRLKLQKKIKICSIWPIKSLQIII